MASGRKMFETLDGLRKIAVVLCLSWIVVPFDVYGAAQESDGILSLWEWQNAEREQQTSYLEKMVETIGEIERRKQHFTCVLGGEIYAVTKSNRVGSTCRLRRSPCSETEVPCAAWMNPMAVTCVASMAELSTTQICWDQQSKKNKVDALRYFLSPESTPHRTFLLRVIKRHCAANPASKRCSGLKKIASDIRAGLPRLRPGRLPNRSSDLSKKTTRWFRYLVPFTYASNKCEYNEEKSQFVDESGNRVTVLFGDHGNATQVVKIAENLNSAEKSDYLEFIKFHSHTIEEMRDNARKAEAELIRGQVSWVGVEISEDMTLRNGGYEGVMDWMQQYEYELKKASLSKAQIRDVLILIFDPAQYALYQRYKNGERNFKLIGVDNRRDSSEDYLQRLNDQAANSKLQNLAVDELINNTYPLWMTDSLSKLINLAYEDPPGALVSIKSLERNSKYATLTSDQKRSLKRFAENLKKFHEEKLRLKRADEEEMRRRNEGIASDTLKANAVNGHGVYHVGSLHKEEVLALMTKECQAKANSQSGSDLRHRDDITQ